MAKNIEDFSYKRTTLASSDILAIWAKEQFGSEFSEINFGNNKYYNTSNELARDLRNDFEFKNQFEKFMLNRMDNLVLTYGMNNVIKRAILTYLKGRGLLRTTRNGLLKGGMRRLPFFPDDVEKTIGPKSKTPLFQTCVSREIQHLLEMGYIKYEGTICGDPIVKMVKYDIDSLVLKR